MADPVDPVPTPESAAPTGGAAERRYFWKHPLLKRAPIILIALLWVVQALLSRVYAAVVFGDYRSLVL